MRELQIKIRPVNGGYQIVGELAEVQLVAIPSGAPTYTAVCSTYSQISTRIKSMIDVAKEHMQPAKTAGAA